MSGLTQMQHVFAVLTQMQDMVLTLESHISELEYDMDELNLSSEWGQIREALTGIDETLLGVLPGLEINLDEDTLEREDELIDVILESESTDVQMDIVDQFSNKG